MLNALIHTVIDEGLADEAFIRDRASNFEALKANVMGCSPEAMAPSAASRRDAARGGAGVCHGKASMILWGMGVSQHVHGTDNARCLIALCAVTGQIGKPGSGLHPLRGQNNVQGASDAGLIPMMFPNYQRVDNAGRMPGSKTSGAAEAGRPPGYTVVEIMHKALAPTATRTRCAACTSWARTRP
jgi:formate dehydrogenase major subunit